MSSKSVLNVINVEIDEEGNVTKRLPRVDCEGQLVNTLLQRRYPDIRVARVGVPVHRLEPAEEELVKRKLAQFDVDNIDFRLVGGGSGTKDGKFFAVEARYEKALSERFQKTSQHAIIYFGILTSDCQTLIEEEMAHVLVVQDGQLGTNDCRGWISQRLFQKLGLPEHRFYQFRLAIGNVQAKGCFKVMTDEVAQAAGVDVIIPRSSTKPKIDLEPFDTFFYRMCLWRPDLHARFFQGPMVLGIKAISANGQYGSSYTLIEHAPADSIENEIKPQALTEIQQVIEQARQGNYALLLDALGGSLAQEAIQDSEDEEHTSFESSIVEAVLKADGSGRLAQFPYLNQKLQKLLAKWAFKVCTGGGFTLPSFALADDGLLFTVNGKLQDFSDWIPENAGASSLETKRGLVVRYPIRSKLDLLPYRRYSREEAQQELLQLLEARGADLRPEQAADLLDRQLYLDGVFVLHSKTAAENGGDFDFDGICVVADSRFPRFVESRWKEPLQAQKKNKNPRPPVPWWNLAEFAMEAKGNQIGWITNMKTTAQAAGHHELARELGGHLQDALDSLKHDVKVNFKRLREISAKLPKNRWLDAKRAERISDMPLSVPLLSEADVVGKLYNDTRKGIENLFTNVLPLRDFTGLIRGGPFTKEMHEECQQRCKEFRALCKQNRERAEALKAASDQAKAALEQAKADLEQAKAHNPHDLDYSKVRSASRQVQRANAAIRAHEERSKEDFKHYYSTIQLWAKSKTENRPGWLRALWSIVTQSTHEKATGALPFQAFPQEIIDEVRERTGGQPVRIQMPELPDGEIRYDEDGNVYLVERGSSASGIAKESAQFLFQVTREGKLVVDRTAVRTIQPIPMKAGSGMIRDGEVIFSDVQQHPTLLRGTVLKTSEERKRFLERCTKKFGVRFIVYVENDPSSRLAIASSQDQEVFIKFAPKRPWKAEAWAA